MATGDAAAGRTDGDGIRAVVAHYRHRYLALTETFIGEVVRRHERYSPVVLTHAREPDHGGSDAVPVRVAPAVGLGGRMPVLHGSAMLELRRWRRALAAQIEVVRPSVLHAHFGPEGFAAAAVSRRIGAPLIVSFYGVDAAHLGRHALWRRRFRTLFERAALVLAEGPRMRDRLMALGCAADRIGLQPTAVRLEALPFRPATPPDDGRHILVQACRFVEKKGVDLTIDAFARVAEDWPRAELWLIGDGPERPRLERLARERGVMARVRFHGEISYDRYTMLLRRAHIFVHPSRTATNGDAEGGAPTVLIEAQALGLPIVASTHDDIPFVTARGAALLASENDAAAIAAHIARLLRHPDDWARRVEAGRAHVQTQHDPRVLIRRLEARYDEVRRTAVEAAP